MVQRELLIGIDTGSSVVKTVVGQISEDSESPLRVIGVGKALAKGLKKGSVVDMKEAENSIRLSIENAEKVTGFPINEAYVGLGGDHIFSSIAKGVVAISRVDGEIVKEDIDRVIDASQTMHIPHNNEVLHVLPQRYSVDDNINIKDPIGMTGVRLGVEALTIQGLYPNIKTLAKVLANIGLNVKGFVVNSLAAANSVLDKRQKELGVILIDIGVTTTDIIVYEDNEIKHIKILPIGAGHITNDIAIGLRTNIDLAEKVKLEYGIVNSDDVSKYEKIDLSKLDEQEQGIVMRKEVAMIIEARLEEILKMVNKELKKIKRESLLPAGAVITGGGAKLRGIIEKTKEILKLPVQIGFPQDTGEIIDEVDDPVYATSIGLLVWQLSHQEKSTNERVLGNFVKNVFIKIKEWIKSFLP